MAAEQIEPAGEVFEHKIKRLAAKLEEQFAESARLEVESRKNMMEPGHGA